MGSSQSRLQDLEDSICNDDPIAVIKSRIGDVAARERRQDKFWGSKANSPMHAAAAMGRPDVIKALSIEGFGVNVGLFSGTPPYANCDVEYKSPLAIALECR